MTRNERELSPENSEIFRVAKLLEFLQPLRETSLLTPFLKLNYSWIFIKKKINLFLWVFAAVTVMSLYWDLGVTVISVQMKFSHTTKKKILRTWGLTRKPHKSADLENAMYFSHFNAFYIAWNVLFLEIHIKCSVTLRLDDTMPVKKLICFSILAFFMVHKIQGRTWASLIEN